MNTNEKQKLTVVPNGDVNVNTLQARITSGEGVVTFEAVVGDALSVYAVAAAPGACTVTLSVENTSGEKLDASVELEVVSPTSPATGITIIVGTPQPA